MICISSKRAIWVKRDITSYRVFCPDANQDISGTPRHVVIKWINYVELIIAWERNASRDSRRRTDPTDVRGVGAKRGVEVEGREEI